MKLKLKDILTYLLIIALVFTGVAFSRYGSTFPSTGTAEISKFDYAITDSTGNFAAEYSFVSKGGTVLGDDDLFNMMVESFTVNLLNKSECDVTASLKLEDTSDFPGLRWAVIPEDYLLPDDTLPDNSLDYKAILERMLLFISTQSDFTLPMGTGESFIVIMWVDYHAAVDSIRAEGKLRLTSTLTIDITQALPV